jgi:hypothetical protein
MLLIKARQGRRQNVFFKTILCKDKGDGSGETPNYDYLALCVLQDRKAGACGGCLGGSVTVLYKVANHRVHIGVEQK